MAATPFAQQVTEAVRGMSPTQRALAGAITLVVLLALAGLALGANHEPKGVLASNLAPQDASAMVAQLDKLQVPYELGPDQRTILVPESRVGSLRLKFAGDGLVGGDRLGFEKLESAGLGTTDFSQKVIHRRALEQGLAHTIMSLQQVAEATVHLSPASDSPFLSEREEAKASVLLKLRGGRALPDENTQAIVNLVAASVEGLKPEQVVVIDQFSRILSRAGRDPMVGASDAQKKLAREEEDHLVRRVMDLLEPVVGLGKVRATAHVELDFDKVRLNEERFDPQGQVERSVQQKEERGPKKEGEGGDKKESTTNYEISKSVRAVDQATGNVKRVSLAVIVDDSGAWEKDAKGEPVLKHTPRAADELKKIHDQVAAAVGIQPTRGDALTVENMAFAPLLTNPREEAEAKRQAWMDLLRQGLPSLTSGLVALGGLFLVVLPLLKRLRGAAQAAGAAAAPEATAPSPGAPRRSNPALERELEAELAAEAGLGVPEAQRRELIKRRLQVSAQDAPESLAGLVRTWLVEEGR